MAGSSMKKPHMTDKSSSRWLLVRLRHDSDSGSSSDPQVIDLCTRCCVVGDRNALKRLLDHTNPRTSSSSSEPGISNTPEDSKRTSQEKESKKKPNDTTERKTSEKKVSWKNVPDEIQEIKVHNGNCKTDCKTLKNKASENRANKHICMEKPPDCCTFFGKTEPVQVIFENSVFCNQSTSKMPKSAPTIMVSSNQLHKLHQKGKPDVTQVEWAFTKVTYFSDSTRVYEVRQPSREPPEGIPDTKGTHGFFITKSCKRDSKTDQPVHVFFQLEK